MFQNKIRIALAGGLASSFLLTIPAVAQQYPPPPQQANPPYQERPQYPPQQQGQYPQQAAAFNQPANFSPDQLNNLVSRIALYPDPLLAQIFAASTFPDQIQPAAQWADQHHYLTGAALAQAIQNDQLNFDPSVQALLPFPSVLDMMAGDMNWTSQLGNAFLSQGPMLEDAVQNMRRQASNNGYLKSNGQISVNNGEYITIAPVNSGYVVVPYYDPAIVFYRPWRPGFVGISFGYGVGIGSFFNPWGWGGAYFGWDRHAVYINNAVWGRNWDNRMNYAHPYAGVERREWMGGRPEAGRGPEFRGGPEGGRGPEFTRGPEVGRPEIGRGAEPGRAPVGNRGGFPAASSRPEQHQLQGRSDGERHAAQTGRPAPRESHQSGHDEHRH